MRSVTAFTLQASAEDLAQAKRCLDLLKCHISLLNVPQWKPEDSVHENDIVVVFSETLRRRIQSHIETKKLNVTLVVLPEIKHLYNKAGNESFRTQAFDTLTRLKESISQDIFHPTFIVVTEQDLPEINLAQIAMLKKLTSDKGHDSCFQTCKNGKLIEISNSSDQIESAADIRLTFEEVFMVRQVMDVLKVDEVKLVFNPS